MNYLILRVIAYILSGLLGGLAASYAGLSYNPDTQILTLDVAQVSEFLGLAVTGFIGGGSFLLSRISKSNGGTT